MKRKIIAWILWIVGIGYIIFYILTGGLFIAFKEDTYFFTLQESRGAYFLSPMLPIHLTQIKVPFVFWYLCGWPRKLDNLTWCKMPVKLT